MLKEDDIFSTYRDIMCKYNAYVIENDVIRVSKLVSEQLFKRS